MELGKITYRFADGHVEEMEVEQEVAEALKELDRQEYNNNHRETRRHTALDALEYEGEYFIDQNFSVEGVVLWKQDIGFLLSAIHSLDAKQQELIIAVFFKRRTVSQIARQSGVSQAAISQRLQTALKNLKKLLKKNLIDRVSRGLKVKGLILNLENFISGGHEKPA